MEDKENLVIGVEFSNKLYTIFVVKYEDDWDITLYKMIDDNDDIYLEDED